MKYLFVLLLAFIPIWAQTAPDTTSLVPSGDSGELHSAQTDYLIKEAFQTKQRLFVISRRGSTDSHPNIEFRRLQHLKIYFSHKRLGNEELVYAVGDQVRGEGRLEYYLGSALRLIVYARKNAVPNYTCCPDYIPPRKPKQTKSGN